MREDLYHRLNVLTLDLPPLRERKGDLPLLAEHFITQICQQLGINVLEYEQDFIRKLETHHWSGNLRELYNVIYRACSLSHGYRLSAKEVHLPEKRLEVAELLIDDNTTLDELMNQFEASVLRKFYSQFPSTRKLAQRLGVSHTAIANKLRAYGIGKE